MYTIVMLAGADTTPNAMKCVTKCCERSLVCIKIPRSDTNEVGELEVTVTSELHARTKKQEREEKPATSGGSDTAAQGSADGAGSEIICCVMSSLFAPFPRFVHHVQVKLSAASMSESGATALQKADFAPDIPAW